MRLIFVGTTSSAINVLERLIKSTEHHLLGVVTQPDRCCGRGLKKSPLPIKELAQKHHYRLYQPAEINNPAFINQIKELSPDAVVVAGYGQIISQSLLVIPKYGWLNIHPSLLPKYRGASPVTHTILNGDDLSGVTIIKMTAQMDAGPIIAQESVPVKPDETTPQLEERLFNLGGTMLIHILPRLERDEIEFRRQSDDEATYAPRLTKKDGLINWQKPAFMIYNHIRAMQGWPGAYTFCYTQKYRALRVNVSRTRLGLKGETSSQPPGTIIKVTPQKLVVNTGDGILQLLELQPAGKRVMTAQDFINGYRIKEGDRYGNG